METSATKKTVLIIVFVVVGAGIIAGAMWYANNILNGQPILHKTRWPRSRLQPMIKLRLRHKIK